MTKLDSFLTAWTFNGFCPDCDINIDKIKRSEKKKKTKKTQSSVRSDKFAAKFAHAIDSVHALLTVSICGHANFKIRNKKIADSKISGVISRNNF